jgi:unsaturated rhamnogalacturonyl hydrolase
MFGSFIDLNRVTLDPAPRDLARLWLDVNIAAGYAITSSDTGAPVGVAVPIWKWTGDAKYKKPIDEFLAYIDHEALRTPEGGLNHLGVTDALGVALWVDSLFMFGQPLVRQTHATGDPAPLAEMTKQVGIFIDRLQDSSGFFHHATENFLAQDPDVFWGRGNGWVVWALADYLRERQLRGERDEKAEVALRKLAAAVVKSQDAATGLWWTVLNKPGETYLETSATALFAAGLARGWRIGVLGDEVLPVIAKAMTAVKAKVIVGADGPVVTGVSGPTNVGTLEVYKAVKTEDDLPYGIGAVVFALLETSGLPNP